MRKTIAAMALFAAASTASGLPIFDEDQKPPPVKKYCLEVDRLSDRSQVAGCDATDNNLAEGKRLGKNGCAKGQVALTIVGESYIDACMPAGMVQL